MASLRYLTTLSAAVLGAVYTFFGIAAAFTPLLHTLGYEFAFAAGLLAAVCAGPFTLRLARRHDMRETGTAAGRELVTLWARLVLAHCLLLAIPFAILLANAWLTPNCAVLEGSAFFLLIPVVTVFFATALALLCRTLFRGAAAGFAFAGVLLAVAAHPVLQILSQPQLFAYNHLVGVFVGVSWDEAQPSLSTLLLYRVTTLAFTVLMLCAAAAVASRRQGGAQPPSWRAVGVSALLAGLTVLAALAWSDDLGFSTSADKTQRTLGHAHRTRHFVIWYDTASFTQGEIIRVGEEHEFRLHQVSQALGIEWERTITSYLYPDATVKRRLLGTETSQVARPWVREIHLDAGAWRESLAHELVHVVGSAASDNPIGGPVFRTLGLLEGLAMAVEWDYGSRTLHEHSAAMLHLGILPHAERFITTSGFLTGASSSSYVAAGSFTRWLMDTRGCETLLRAYRLDDIPSVMGASLASLDSAWRSYLRSVPRLLPDRLSTLYLFKGQPIFRKICPRAVTERNRRAAAAYREGRLLIAERLYREADALSPNGRSFFWRTLMQLRLGNVDSVLAMTGRALGDSARAFSVLPVSLFRGDAAAARGDSALADSCYTVLAVQRPGGWIERDAHIRRSILRARPLVRDIVWRVFDRENRRGPLPDSVRAASIGDLRAALTLDPSRNAIRYMLGQRLADDTARRLEAAVLLREISGEDFAYECLSMAADLLYDAGEFLWSAAVADIAYAQAETPAQVHAAIVRLERSQWKLSGRGDDGSKAPRMPFLSQRQSVSQPRSL